jgi:uncharacterized Fe-S cluster-containing radical SAM superfamily protein
MPATIDTERASRKYRGAAVDLDARRVLITNFHGSEQERDLTEPANCRGYGRVRHFRWDAGGAWPENPLPIAPACRALGLPIAGGIRAQVFQSAVCNWRCWYCFVDFKLLAGSRKHSAWMSPADLIDLYLEEPDSPVMLDLSGGQPDLVPEWLPWMMEELRARDLAGRLYLWSDDNLSNDYFWRFLSADQIRLVARYPNYGRVCCFKGFDEESFSFNTAAEAALFEGQFELIRRFVELGIDLYAYVTLTAPTNVDIRGRVRRFVDKLQSVDAMLPLRTVPLEVRAFTPVQGRMDEARTRALAHQHEAAAAWLEELTARFSDEERNRLICDVPLGGRGGDCGPGILRHGRLPQSGR